MSTFPFYCLYVDCHLIFSVFIIHVHVNFVVLYDKSWENVHLLYS